MRSVTFLIVGLIACAAAAAQNTTQDELDRDGKCWTVDARYRELNTDWFKKTGALDVNLLVHARDSFDLSWWGTDIAAGRIENLDRKMRPGEPVEVRLEYAPRHKHEPLRVTLPGSPDAHRFRELRGSQSK